jgi:YesN/AraC family two-component response regulator
MIKILVVDDERAVCASIQKSFEYLGFTVSTATTAARAMELFAKKKPKIVFLDILMPEADGLDLLRQFKQQDPGVKVIMVTAKSDEATRQRAISLGADEFITKPFGTNDLRSVAMDKISHLLRQDGPMAEPRLLIVDDEPKARDTLKDFIRPRYGCDIREADNGKTAVTRAQELQPDIILLDIRMPGINGIDAIRRIKAVSPEARVIIISAWKSPDVAAKAMAQGAFTYLDKPIEFELFKERFEAALMSLGKLVKKPAG